MGIYQNKISILFPFQIGSSFRLKWIALDKGVDDFAGCVAFFPGSGDDIVCEVFVGEIEGVLHRSP